MTSVRTLGLVLVAVLGVALAAVTLGARERLYPVPEIQERVLFLRSGEVADRMALTFDALAADVYWIRTIQHYGRDYKDRSRPRRFELLQPLLDLTTTLDEHFLIAYRFGAIFLAMSPPHGPGRPDQALALLQKGLAANPDQWQLAHDLGFTHYLYTGDYAAAADWFRKAARMPGAPGWMGPLAAATVAQGGNRLGAKQMLLELRTASEDYIRQAAERALAQLEALDRIDRVQERVREFQSKTKRTPSGWQELIAARLIPGIPLDPQGVPLAYNASTGEVTLATASPLQPIPKMLQPK